MAWNRPKENAAGRAVSMKPPRRGHRPRPTMVAIAGAVVVGAGIAAWLLLPGGEARPDAAPTKRGRIAAATPAASKRTAPDKAAARPAPTNRVEAALAKLDESAAPVAIRPLRKVVIQPWHTNRTFKTTAEQLIGWMCTTRLGDLPAPIPPLTENDLRDFASMLISRNDVLPDDTEDIAALKEAVDEVKKEMSAYIRKGGDPNDFMQYYYHEQLKAYERHTMAQGMVEDATAEDPDFAKELAAKFNEAFEAEGLTPVHFDSPDGDPPPAREI